MEQTSKKAEILWLNTMFLIATPVLAATLVPWYVFNYGIVWQELVVATLLWWFTSAFAWISISRLSVCSALGLGLHTRAPGSGQGSGRGLQAPGYGFVLALWAAAMALGYGSRLGLRAKASG